LGKKFDQWIKKRRHYCETERKRKETGKIDAKRDKYIGNNKRAE
jgi:hypothetical protein